MGKEVLVYFFHRYLDFRKPEVEALANMGGWGGDLKVRYWVEEPPTWPSKQHQHLLFLRKNNHSNNDNNTSKY